MTYEPGAWWRESSLLEKLLALVMLLAAEVTTAVPIAIVVGMALG